MEKRETILYFGSFNPIHNGHTAIARYVIEKGFCEELWFVVSPQNPLKSENILAGELDRLRMAEIAVSEKLAGLDAKVSDVEFGLPRPSFTIDTLKYLKDPVRQRLSHQLLHASFYVLSLPERPDPSCLPDGAFWVSREQVGQLAFPKMLINRWP